MIDAIIVIARSEATRRSTALGLRTVDCFAALAMTSEEASA